MIPPPDLSLRHCPRLAGAPSPAPPASVPAWLRRAVPDGQSLAGQDVEDIMLAAGAALSALDAVVRRQERWAGAWRHRLALAAAAATAKQAGRIEDEAALRDAVLLTKDGDDVGPAGRLLLAWRRLAVRAPEDLLTEKSLGEMLEEFGHVPDAAAVGDLVGEGHRLCAGGMVGMLIGAFIAAEQYGLGRGVGAWLADALVAQRLGWAYAIPLLGNAAGVSMNADRSRRPAGIIAAAGSEFEAERAKNLLAAQARAALCAIDLSADLGRRAEKLLAVAPRLRARGADSVVERLLSGDAMVASDPVAGMSDRALRRLFDRLVELGAVRELSGRPTFRIYGL